MASPIAQLDADLLRRYDMAGPRYTSYPTAREFTPAFGEGEYRRNLLLDPPQSTAPLSLYVHIPFCESPCFYCGCNRIITRDHLAADRYLNHLQREAALTGQLLGDTGPVRQLHLGGGTPNFLHSEQLRQLIDILAGSFRLTGAAERDYSVELDPRYLQAGFLQTLAELGFNRASFGVQDFDPEVQRAVNRIQSEAQTLEAIAECRRRGLRSINVDLLYGLPGQRLAGFRRTLGTIIGVRPDRIAVYGYAHLPQLFKAQRQLDPALLPDAQTRLALLRLAIQELTAAGYRYIGLDHFALPEDELARARERGDLHRNFMGYTTCADCDLIGLGVSAISHIGNCFSQNHRDLKAWEAALDAGHLPVWRGLASSVDDRLRAEVIQQIMCQGAVDIHAIEERHGIVFAQYFASALKQLGKLAADGLVTVSAQEIRATERGQLLLRLIAMCFDHYLAPSTEAAEPQRFSRVV